MKAIWTSKITRWILLVIILLSFQLPIKTETIQGQDLNKVVYLFSMPMYESKITHFIDLLKSEHTFGLSRYDIPVENEIKHYFPRSFWILVPSFFLSILLGIVKGIFDYFYSVRKLNLFGNGLTWLGQSLPDFFMIISIQYGLLLLMRMGFPHLDLFGYEHWYNIFFPIAFLSMYPLFYIARITSSALATEATKNYVRTARAMGASTRTILTRHMLKNAMHSIVSHFFTVMVLLIGSLPIVEFLTFYRGAGRRLIEAFGINPGLPERTSIFIDQPVAIGFTMMFLLLLFIALWVSNGLKAIVIPGNRIKVSEIVTSLLLFSVIGIALILIILLPTDIGYHPIGLGTIMSVFQWGML